MRAFTPQQASAADLDAVTVGRQAVLAGLHDKLLAAALTEGRPHVLLVGPRGSGKTHLIEVALLRAAAVDSFAQRVAVVRIAEDAVAVTRYEDLLRAVLLHLAVDPAASPDPEEAIDRALGDRVAVLVVENLDRVFEDLGLAGQRALRAWVETSGRVMLLTTAARPFPAVLQRDKPWFGGLAVFVLPGLSPEEGRQLLLESARRREDQAMADFLHSPTGLARVRALTALTGGTPRAWALVVDRADVRALDAVLPVLLEVVEALVPQQQEALAGLSPNERRLVAAMATAGAGKVADLAAAAQVEQRTAAASLGRLAEAGWVVAQKPEHADRRTTYYRLRDPMLRHHLQFRAGGDVPLPLTVALLRAHYEGAVADGQDDLTGASLTAALLGPDADAAASALLGAVAQVRSGGAAPAVAGASSWHRLGAALLAAAGGDEIERLGLGQELIAVIEGQSRA